MFQNGILCIYTPVLVCNEMKNSLNIVKKNVSNVYQLLFIAVKKITLPRATYRRVISNLWF